MNDAQLAARSLFYPFSNGGLLLVLGLSLLPLAPYGDLVFWPVPFVFLLPILRASAGHTRDASVMPGLVAYTDLRSLGADGVRCLLLSAAVLWPLTLHAALSLMTHEVPEAGPVSWLPPALPLLGLVMTALYPASLAALAETGSLVQALTPAWISQASKDMGPARRGVIAFSVLGAAIVAVIGLLLSFLPPAGDVIARVLLVYYLFQLAHLTGWTLRRSHRF